MNDIPIEPDDRLHDPPLIDSIRYDSVRGIYQILFIPSDDVSGDEKESVSLDHNAQDFARIDALFQEISRLAGDGRSISHIVHAGGGNYSILFTDADQTTSAECPDNAVVQQIADRLKQIADAAQMAFRSVVHH